MHGESYKVFKPEVRQWVYDNFEENSTILDVGIGCGTYWDLLNGKFKNIDGVEVFKPNIDQLQGKKYREIFNVDIKDFKYDYYDLVIFGDILEHLTIEDAKSVLDYAFKHSKNVIVAVPYMYEQDEIYGNKYEKHLQPDLTSSIMIERYPELTLLYGDNLYGYYIKQDIKSKIAVCSICKNENKYIREFVEHYKALGFDNIILFDNNDVDGERFEDVINDYIENGFVILENVRGKKLAMFPSYNYCIKTYGKKYDWIAFFDCDEFLVLTKTQSIKEFINTISSDADCIQINWMEMDDNGLVKYDNRPLMERFTHQTDKYFPSLQITKTLGLFENSHLKSIVKCTEWNINNCVFQNAHFPYNCRKYVNASNKTNFHGINPSVSRNIDWENAYIKHFSQKTIEEFLYTKFLRGFPDISYHHAIEHNEINKFFRKNKQTSEKEAIVKEFFEKNKELINKKLEEETSDVGLYVLSHKKIDYSIPDSFKTLQVGAALTDENISEYKDNTGDNISDKNKYYCETTGIYWIWKNCKDSIKGQVQYRRFFNKDRLDIYNVKEILKISDIILAQPFSFGNMTIEQQYELKHNIDDLLEVKDIISKMFPEYIESYDKYIKHGNILFYSNSFITTSETYDKICSFIFPVLFEFEKRHNLSDEHDRLEHAKEALKKWPEHKETSHDGEPDVEYQSRFCGYLFERLFTLYLLHNNLKIYNCGNYIMMEKNMKI